MVGCVGPASIKIQAVKFPPGATSASCRTKVCNAGSVHGRAKVVRVQWLCATFAPRCMSRKSCATGAGSEIGALVASNVGTKRRK